MFTAGPPAAACTPACPFPLAVGGVSASGGQPCAACLAGWLGVVGWWGGGVGGVGTGQGSGCCGCGHGSRKDISAHCAYSTQHQANKQEMVSHVVKPKVRRSPKATSLRNETLANPKACAQAAFISHQRGRPCLTKCALAQADISRQELEASMAGLFVRLGVEQ
jgi:hypothetical protein